jgi:long-chain fatty acid transport protein
VYAIATDVDYDSPSGQSSSTDNSLEPVPHLFYSYGMEKLPIALGLGLYAPYGLVNEWPEDSGFRSIALKSEMKYMTVNPVIAWRVLTNLSIAAGPTINFSEIDLTQGVTPFPKNDTSRLTGDAVAAGFNLGVLWQVHPKVSLGASYRSRTEMDYDGRTEIDFVVPPPGYPQNMTMDAEAELTFPQNIVVGISFRPTPDWNIEFNVDWTDWDQVNTVNVDQLIPATLTLNWESSIYYELGVTRKLGENWRASLGYIFNENSVPDETYNPWIPDQDRHFACCGLGFKRGKLSLDVAYQFGIGPERTVTGSPISPVGQSADGIYKYISHAFAVTAGFSF